MFTGTKATILRECERRNKTRNVCRGSLDHRTFFQHIQGDLLVSGCAAANMEFLADMITEYMYRDNMPTIVLSSHRVLFSLLRERLRSGTIDRVMFSDQAERNYHLFYGMSPQQLLYFIRLAAEMQGYSTSLDLVLQYASAALNIVAASYPVSLPALIKLLQADDDAISSHALQMGLSNVIADTIRANHEAGIVLRRICEHLERVFEGIYVSGINTKYNFQSGAWGNVSVMVLDFVSENQKLMNTYLKTELFFTLKRVPKIRVIADEVDFTGNEDELFRFLLQMKRQ